MNELLWVPHTPLVYFTRLQPTRAAQLGALAFLVFIQGNSSQVAVAVAALRLEDLTD